MWNVKLRCYYVGMGDQLLKARFVALQGEYPHHSSYINFVRLMREEGVSNKRVLARYFAALVDKGDYEGIRKDTLVNKIFANGSVKPYSGTPKHGIAFKHVKIALTVSPYV